MTVRPKRRAARAMPAGLALLGLLAAAPHPTPGAPPAAAPDTLAPPPPLPLLVPGQPDAGAADARDRTAKAREWVARGRGFERTGQPASAIAAYRNAVMLDRTVPEAYYRMGLLFLSANDIGEAIQCFVAEVERHPGHTAAGRELGLALARTGDHGRALQQLELLVRRDPRDGESWWALGFAYMAASRPKDAESALRRAVRLTPARAIAHRDLGAVLASLGRDREARSAYARAAELDPRDASVWVNLGNLERRAGALEAALAAYQAAERRDSTAALALQGQIAVLAEADRLREAGDVYRRWLARTPDDHNARLEAIRFFEDRARGDIALELARDGVRANPESGDARLVFGMALASNGDHPSGLSELRRAQELFRSAGDRELVRRLIATLRFNAPDSLRALYREDSVRHERGVP
jgi:tetratricopeptide (TPR) repeat protein